MFRFLLIHRRWSRKRCFVAVTKIKSDYWRRRIWSLSVLVLANHLAQICTNRHLRFLRSMLLKWPYSWEGWIPSHTNFDNRSNSKLILEAKANSTSRVFTTACETKVHATKYFQLAQSTHLCNNRSSLIDSDAGDITKYSTLFSPREPIRRHRPYTCQMYTKEMSKCHHIILIHLWCPLPFLHIHRPVDVYGRIGILPLASLNRAKGPLEGRKAALFPCAER